MTQPPIPNSYCVAPGRLYAGEYPGSPSNTPDAQATAKLQALVDAGIRVFIDLTEPRELDSYAESLDRLARACNTTVIHQRHAIRDADTCSESAMRGILDAIDAHHTADRSVYVHCWGGIGRTGMIVGCWLIRHGASPDDALVRVSAGWQSMSPYKLRRNAGKSSPETAAQIDMVRAWRPGT
ncbi:MAG: protein-tyrosine phosphatase family protein [Gemmatimonas sp.]